MDLLLDVTNHCEETWAGYQEMVNMSQVDFEQELKEEGSFLTEKIEEMESLN